MSGSGQSLWQKMMANIQTMLDSHSAHLQQVKQEKVFLMDALLQANEQLAIAKKQSQQVDQQTRELVRLMQWGGAKGKKQEKTIHFDEEDNEVYDFDNKAEEDYMATAATSSKVEIFTDLGIYDRLLGNFEDW